jgi:hypothetical protein
MRGDTLGQRDHACKDLSRDGTRPNGIRESQASAKPCKRSADAAAIGQDRADQQAVEGADHPAAARPWKPSGIT